MLTLPGITSHLLMVNLHIFLWFSDEIPTFCVIFGIFPSQRRSIAVPKELGGGGIVQLQRVGGVLFRVLPELQGRVGDGAVPESFGLVLCL